MTFFEVLTFETSSNHYYFYTNLKKKSKFKIEFLDHVALHVKNIEASATWYENVLGLKRYQLPEWGEFPIFMLTNKSGIALFYAKTADTELNTKQSSLIN